MDQTRVGRVPEVQHDQVEQIDYEKDLCDPESTSHPQHDEAKCEEVVLPIVRPILLVLLLVLTKMKWLPTLAALIL